MASAVWSQDVGVQAILAMLTAMAAGRISAGPTRLPILATRSLYTCNFDLTVRLIVSRGTSPGVPMYASNLSLFLRVATSVLKKVLMWDMSLASNLNERMTNEAILFALRPWRRKSSPTLASADIFGLTREMAPTAVVRTSPVRYSR